MATGTTKKAAALRAEVYQYLRDNGYLITMEHQRGLSKILKAVLEQNMITIEQPPKQMVEHQITCPRCLGVRLMRNRKGKMYIKIMSKTADETAGGPSIPA